MRTHQIPDSIAYVRKVFAHESAAMLDCRAWMSQLGVEGMHVGPEEGAYLTFFAQLIGARKILELGTLGGYSGLWLARALPEDGLLYTVERREVFAERARAFFAQEGIAHKVQVLTGDAHSLLPALAEHAPYDLIFIDADKSGYPDYLAWSARHLRTGGLFIADNTFLYGAVWEGSPPKGITFRQWQAMRDFNEQVASSPAWRSILLPTGEGLVLAQRT